MSRESTLAGSVVIRQPELAKGHETDTKVLVDGQRLEDIVVTPTIEVPFDSRYAAGADPQLDRAVQVLAGD